MNCQKSKMTHFTSFLPRKKRTVLIGWTSQYIGLGKLVVMKRCWSQRTFLADIWMAYCFQLYKEMFIHIYQYMIYIYILSVISDVFWIIEIFSSRHGSSRGVGVGVWSQVPFSVNTQNLCKSRIWNGIGCIIVGLISSQMCTKTHSAITVHICNSRS